MANKVLYGLKNVHYALYTESTGTYGTVKEWPGAVSISLSAEGESNTFYADNMPYFVTVSNAGYSGDFESAKIPADFRTAIMGETKDTTTGIVIEDSAVAPKPFALMFEFQGDETAARYCMYNCKISRPNIESSTTEEGVEVQTVTATITCIPQPDTGYVKAFCEDTSASAYSGWYSEVPEI